MQLGGALLCRRFGGKRVLLYGAIFWSLFTVLTPLAAAYSLPMLLICRVLMGVSEGVAFPAVYHFLSTWIPASERARSVALFLTGANLGSVIALVVSPVIIELLNWESVFYIFGSVGLFWIVAWHFLAYDRDDDKTTSGYTAVATRDAKDGTERESRSMFTRYERRVIRTILTDARCMAVLLTQTLFSMIHYTILFWLPTYFKQVYEVSTASLSFTFIPYLSMAVFSNVGGYLSDRLLLTNLTTTRVRKLVTLLADTVAAISIVLFSRAGEVPLAVGLISVSMGAMSLNSGGFESNYFDMATPEAAGLFKAVCNTAASLAGFMAIPVSTGVLEVMDGSWRATFAALAACYVLKMAIYCSFASSDTVLGEDLAR